MEGNSFQATVDTSRCKENLAEQGLNAFLDFGDVPVAAPLLHRSCLLGSCPREALRALSQVGVCCGGI